MPDRGPPPPLIPSDRGPAPALIPSFGGAPTLDQPRGPAPPLISSSGRGPAPPLVPSLDQSVFRFGRPSDRIQKFEGFDKRDYKDAFRDIGENPSYYVPYLNVTETFDQVAVFRAVKAMENDTADQAQIALVDEYITKMNSQTTAGFKFVSTVFKLPSFALEFITAGGIIKGTGKAVLGKATTESAKEALKRISSRKLLGEGLSEKIGKKLIGKKVADAPGMTHVAAFFTRDTAGTLSRKKGEWYAKRKALVGLTDEAAREAAEKASKDAFKATLGPVGQHLLKGGAEALGPRALLHSHRIAGGITANMTPVYGLDQNESGELHRVLMAEGDGFWEAFGRAYGDMAIENFSEQTAESFFMLRGMWGAEAEQFLRAGVLDKAAKKLSEATGLEKSPAMKKVLKDHFFGPRDDVPGFLEKAGWFGVIPEIGEEAIGGVLRQATGISPFGLPDLEDVAVMAMAFAFNPLAIGNYAADTATKHADQRVAKALEGIEALEVNDNEEDPVRRIKVQNDLKGGLDSLKEYIEFAVREDIPLWDKFKRLLYQTRGQNMVREAWREKTRTDLDALVAWQKAANHPDADAETVLTDDHLRRWMLDVTGNDQWVESDEHLNRLTSFQVSTMSDEEKKKRGIRRAFLIDKPPHNEPWLAEELEMMEKYPWIFEVQAVTDLMPSNGTPIQDEEFNLPWEKLTPKQQDFEASMRTTVTIPAQRMEIARKHYEMMREVTKRTRGSGLKWFTQRKLGLIGTSKEFLSKGMLLSPEARPLPRAKRVVPDGVTETKEQAAAAEKKYQDEYEDKYMAFQGARTNLRDRSITVDGASQRNNVAEELVHQWSIQPRANARDGFMSYDPIIEWGRKEAELLDGRIKQTISQLKADKHKLTPEEIARHEGFIKRGNQLLEQLVGGEDLYNEFQINETWAKLFKMIRLGHAKFNEETSEVTGEADENDKWLLSLKLTLPAWADGMVNSSSPDYAPHTLSYLAAVGAPYDPSQRVIMEEGVPRIVNVTEDGEVISRTTVPTDSSKKQPTTPLSPSPSIDATKIDGLSDLFDQAVVQLNEETHEYTILEKSKTGEVVVLEPDSVTTVIGEHFLFDFNEDKVAARVAERDQTTVDQVKADWEGDRRVGDEIHEEISNTIRGFSEDPASAALEELITQLQEEAAENGVESEITVWTDEVAGTIDISVRKPGGSYDFYDIKTMERDPHTNPHYNQPYLDEGGNLVSESKAEKHRLQLKAYKEIVRKRRGLNVDHVWIIPVIRSTGEIRPRLLADATERTDQLFKLVFEDFKEATIPSANTGRVRASGPEGGNLRDAQRRAPGSTVQAVEPIKEEKPETVEVVGETPGRRSRLRPSQRKPTVKPSRKFPPEIVKEPVEAPETDELREKLDDIFEDRAKEKAEPEVGESPFEGDQPLRFRDQDGNLVELTPEKAPTEEEVKAEEEARTVEDQVDRETTEEEKQAEERAKEEQEPQFSQDSEDSGEGEVNTEPEINKAEHQEQVGQTPDNEQGPVDDDGAPYAESQKVNWILTRPEIQHILQRINPIGTQGEDSMWEMSRDPDFIAAVQTEEAWLAYLTTPSLEWFKKAWIREDGSFENRYWAKGIQGFFASLNKPDFLQTELTRKWKGKGENRRLVRESHIIVANQASRGNQWKKHITEIAEIRFRDRVTANASRTWFAQQVGRIDTRLINEETGETEEFFNVDKRLPHGAQRIDPETGELRPMTAGEMAVIIEHFSNIPQDVWLEADRRDKKLLRHIVHSIDFVLTQFNAEDHAELRQRFVTDVFVGESSRTRKDSKFNVRSHIQRALDVTGGEEYLSGRFRGPDGDMLTTYVKSSDVVDRLSRAGGERLGLGVAMWAGRRRVGFEVKGKRGVDGKDEGWNELMDDFWLLWGEMDDEGVGDSPTYYQPLGQLGDHTRPVLIESRRYGMEDARARYIGLFTDEEGNTTPEGARLFAEGYAMSITDAFEQAKAFKQQPRFGKHQEFAEQFFWNWLYNNHLNRRIAFGNESQYKGPIDQTKRSNSSISDGSRPQTIIPGPQILLANQGIGPKINTFYVDDEFFSHSDEKLSMPLLDGALYASAEWIRRIKNGMSATQFPRHWTAKTWEKAVLHASKMLHSGRVWESEQDRVLHKGNTFNLDPLAEELAGSIYEEMKRFMDEFNEGKAWEDQIHQIIPTSTAKVREKGLSPLRLFSSDGQGGYTFSAPAHDQVVIAHVNSEGLRVQNPLVHETKPRTRRFPIQGITTWYGLPNSDKITEVSNLGLDARNKRFQDEEFNPVDHLSQEKNSDLIDYNTYLDSWNPLIAERMNAVVASKIEQNYVRPTARKSLVQEVPFGSADGVLDYELVKLVGENWVKADGEDDAQQVRMARVRLALDDKVLRQEQDSEYTNWADVEALLRGRFHRLYIDLFVPDSEGIVHKDSPIRKHEFKKENGTWIIPGGFNFLVRVPTDDFHSIIGARQGKRIAGGLDFAVMHQRLQEIAGSDNDGDQRHALMLWTDGEGNILQGGSKSSNDKFLYNRMLLLAMQDYNSVDIWKKSQLPQNLNAYDESVNRWKADHEERHPVPYLNSPEGYRQSFEIHRSRQKLVGIFARATATASVILKTDIGLKSEEAGTPYDLEIKGGVGDRAYLLKIARVARKRLDSGELRGNATHDQDRMLAVHLGRLQNMALDAGADPKQEYMGINDVTAGMVVTLLMMNPDIRTDQEFTDYMGQISNYLNSIHVREFVEQKRLVDELDNNQGATKKAMFEDAASNVRKLGGEGASEEHKIAMAVESNRMGKLAMLWELSEEIREFSTTVKHNVTVPRSVTEHYQLAKSIEKIKTNKYDILNLKPVMVGKEFHPVLHGLDVSQEVSNKLYANDLMNTQLVDELIGRLETMVDERTEIETKRTLFQSELDEIRRDVGRAFLIEAINRDAPGFNEPSNRYSLIARGDSKKSDQRELIVVEIAKQIQARLHKNGKSNAFLDGFVDSIDDNGVNYLRLMSMLRRGQVDGGQMDDVHRGFHNLSTYTSPGREKGEQDFEFTVARTNAEGKRTRQKEIRTYTGKQIQDMIVTESLWRYGPTMSAGRGGWLAFVDPGYWRQKREAIQKTKAEWDLGQHAPDVSNMIFQEIEERHKKDESKITELGEMDVQSDEDAMMSSIVLYSNWGRMNPMTQFFGAHSLHQFLVDVKNWSDAEFHNSGKIIDEMRRLAGEGKLIGHAIVKHPDRDSWDVVDLNDSSNIALEENGEMKFFTEAGVSKLKVVGTFPSEFQADMHRRKLDWQLRKHNRGIDDDDRMLAHEVMEGITVVIEGTTSNFLSADNPYYTFDGKTPSRRVQITQRERNGQPRVDHQGFPIKEDQDTNRPDYVVLDSIEREDADPAKPDAPEEKKRRPFIRVRTTKDRNGKEQPVLNPDGSFSTMNVKNKDGSDVLAHVVKVRHINREGDLIDKVGRDKFAKLVKLTRQAMHARTRMNERMTRVLEQEEWLGWRARYVMHTFMKAEKEKLTQKQKDAARKKAALIWAGKLNTGRSEERVFPDYLTAAIQNGLEPVSLRADDLIRMWTSEIAKIAGNRLVLGSGMMTREMDAAPLWMPQLADDQDALNYDLMKPIGRDVLLESLQIAADYFNQKRLSAWMLAHEGRPIARDRLFQMNLAEDPREGWKRFYKMFGKKDLKQAGYYQPLTEGSKFPGITNWWVRRSADHPGPYSNAAVNILKMIEEKKTRKWNLFGKDWLVGIERFNQWSKTTGLSLSLFHPFALLESFVALGGLTVENFGAIVKWPRTMSRVASKYRLEKRFGHLTAKWIPHGLRVDSTNPNFLKHVDFKQIDQANQTLVQADLDTWIESGIPGIVFGGKMYKKYLHWVDEHLWKTFFPSLKLYMAEYIEEEMIANMQARGQIVGDGDELKRNIARLLNHALGGQNWHEYIWATPERMQLLHLFLFAPDWTLSAFNIAQGHRFPGINKILRVPTSQQENDWIWKKYWPGMAVLVMTAIPQAIQSVIYDLWGDPDEGDERWIFNNEVEKNGFWGIKGVGGHIDVTPMVRKLGWVPGFGYTGDPSGRRRVYMRWAKQATEVFDGWLTNPMGTLFGKSSPAVRTAYEQITGTNTAGWEMRFSGEGLSGFFQDQEGSFWNSRTAYVGKKFVPMSILGPLEGRPSGFIAATSRGTTLYNASTQLAQVLEAYANDQVWDNIKDKQRRSVNLAAMGPDILKAAQNNGYNPEEVVKRAKSHVLGRLYGRFFKALQNDNQKELERVAIAVNRVHGTLDGLTRSMKKRFEDTNQYFSPEDEAAIRLLVHGKLGDVPALDPPTDRRHNDIWIRNILRDNSQKTFVKRILNVDRYPIYKFNEHTHGTHFMSHTEVDGKWIVYPNLVLNKESFTLELHEGADSVRLALDTGNFISFHKEADAEFFAKNYKRVWK